jgi:hypothetical protein
MSLTVHPAAAPAGGAAVPLLLPPGTAAPAAVGAGVGVQAAKLKGTGLAKACRPMFVCTYPEMLPEGSAGAALRGKTNGHASTSAGAMM